MGLDYIYANGVTIPNLFPETTNSRRRGEADSWEENSFALLGAFCLPKKCFIVLERKKKGCFGRGEEIGLKFKRKMGELFCR